MAPKAPIEHRLAVVVMGVCGCGKSTFARALSAALATKLIEGDDLHPAKNIERMSSGEPLTDDDRWPWLEAITSAAENRLTDQPTVVITCSALKQSYRDRLRNISADTIFVYLRGERAAIEERMAARQDHFMPPALIESQFTALQEPVDEADVITLDMTRGVDDLCAAFIAHCEQYGKGGLQAFLPKSRKHIGLIGLGVMGGNLAQNIVDNGYRLGVWDIDPALRADFNGDSMPLVSASDAIEGLVVDLARPRCILLLIKAGNPVDEVLAQLLTLLDEADIVVDLGNSHYQDTARRCRLAAENGLRFLGCGISGGAEGARRGPALMPGGDAAAWQPLRPVFEDIAAKFNGSPCVSWIGPGGAGHFVKMVHNGIEYADMQLIAEAYHLMHAGASLPPEQIAGVFERWNEGELESFLVEATAKILRVIEDDGTALVDRILDRAGQKGTGSWTSQAALEYGVPTTLINDAVGARMLSSLKTLREETATRFDIRTEASPVSAETLITDLEKAMLCARVIGYTQGFMLMRQASDEQEWRLDPCNIAAGWRAGCIIRGRVLNHIMSAFDDDPDAFLLSAPAFQAVLLNQHAALRRVIHYGIDRGLPVAGFAAALAFFDSIRSARLPANLIQAQRDFFGAHQFERTDQPAGEFFHADWQSGTTTKES